MKRSYTVIITLSFLLVLLISSAAAAEPNITGAAGVLMDAETGEVLWAKEETAKRAPASITKILTALVAIEKGNLTDEVVISEVAVDTHGSIVWLRAGETQTLEDLLYAIMLNSGNDAALAIAEHIGEGSIDKFVNMMNEKAKEIGAYSSNFVNPNGLPAEGHYSTAYDIALITRAALKNPVLREIMGTQTRQWNGMDWQSQLVNLNQLLWQYEGSIGGKTGYTSEAGRCLTTAANRNGMELISVVLGSTSQRIWSDSTKVLDYGFENYHKLKLVEAGEEILQTELAGVMVPVLADKDILYLTNKNAGEIPSWKIKLQNLELPLTQGQEIGTLDFVLDDKVIDSVSLVAGKDVDKPITWKDIYIKATMLIFGLVIAALLLKLLLALRKRRTTFINRPRRMGYSRNIKW